MPLRPNKFGKLYAFLRLIETSYGNQVIFVSSQFPHLFCQSIPFFPAIFSNISWNDVSWITLWETRVGCGARNTGFDSWLCHPILCVTLSKSQPLYMYFHLEESGR